MPGPMSKSQQRNSDTKKPPHSRKTSQRGRWCTCWLTHWRNSQQSSLYRRCSQPPPQTGQRDRRCRWMPQSPRRNQPHSWCKNSPAQPQMFRPYRNRRRWPPEQQNHHSRMSCNSPTQQEPPARSRTTHKSGPPSDSRGTSTCQPHTHRMYCSCQAWSTRCQWRTGCNPDPSCYCKQHTRGTGCTCPRRTGCRGHLQE